MLLGFVLNVEQVKPKVSDGLLPSLWEKALSSPLGIKIRTDDPQLLRYQLKRYKVANNREDLNIFETSIVAKDTLLIKRRSDAPKTG